MANNRRIVFGVLMLFLVGMGSGAFSDWGWSNVLEILNSVPGIEFVSPTPDNGSSQSNADIYVNYSVSDLDGDDLYSFVDFDSSLVGWWRMDNDSDYGENDTVVYDWSGSGNNGSVVGASWNSSGRFGGAFEFDGLSDYVDVGSGDDISEGMPSLTVSAWVRNSDTTPNPDDKYILAQNTVFGLYWEDADNTLRFSVNNGTSEQIALAGVYSDTNWKHIVGTYNGSEVQIYVDGVVKDATPPTLIGATATSTNDIYVGIRALGDPDESWNGTMDEVMIFNRSLSEEEVVALYNASKSYHNFTNQSVGNHTFKAYVVDENGGLNYTEERVVSINNSLPVVTLVSPTNWNATTNRSLEFVWSGYDANGDELTYEIAINEHQYAGASICNDDISNDTLSSESYTSASDLACLYDNGYYYNWSVRAHDGTGWGDWSSVWHFNVTAEVEISLVSSSMEFGSMGAGDIENTTGGSPGPFVIDNDGNVAVDVSLNSSALWNTEASDSSYYQFKADNVSGEEGAFSWLSSIVSWFNMPITGKVVGVSGLDYHSGNDSSEVDIRLEVPAGEGPGVKEGTIVFVGSLADGVVDAGFVGDNSSADHAATPDYDYHDIGLASVYDCSQGGVVNYIHCSVNSLNVGSGVNAALLNASTGEVLRDGSITTGFTTGLVTIELDSQYIVESGVSYGIAIGQDTIEDWWTVDSIIDIGMTVFEDDSPWEVADTLPTFDYVEKSTNYALRCWVDNSVSG